MNKIINNQKEQKHLHNMINTNLINFLKTKLIGKKIKKIKLKLNNIRKIRIKKYKYNKTAIFNLILKIKIIIILVHKL